MKINELSKRTDTPISTIRYYEKIGLLPLPKKLENGYRNYSEVFIDYLNVIRFLAGLEFSLSEISELFQQVKNQQLSIEFVQDRIRKHEEMIKTRLQKLTELSTFFKQLTHKPQSIEDFVEVVRKLDFDQ